jgi:tetratricopeptide (TPR) repeat protein
LTDLNRSIELQPDYTWAIAGRGDVYQVLKHYEEAESDYQRAIQLEPDNAPYHNNLGEVYLEWRRLDDAKREFEKRVQMRPENALNGYVSLGLIACYQGNADEARQQFEQALLIWNMAWEQQLQTPAALLENKAIALLCLGQREAALQALKEAKVQLRREDVVDFDRYELLSGAPQVPEGLDQVVATLQQIASDHRGTGAEQ